MSDEAIAVTPLGRVRGRVVDGVATFRGIPYAAPVTSSGRFRAPRTVPGWTGTLDATRTGARCTQSAGSLFASDLGEYFAGGRVGVLGQGDERDDEDCLNLAVLTPRVPIPSVLGQDAGRRPVVVYLHGGGFMVGSGIVVTAAQRFAAEHDVVLVGINHRLGVFGFLATGDIDGDVNAGLLDIVEALRWISANIASFGGDPGNVTVVGDSGGGVKVATLLAMPSARGLLHRAVLESAPELTMRTPAEARADLREVLRLGGVESIGALRQKQPSELFGLGLRLPTWALVPVVDGVTVAADPFSAEAAAVMPGVPVIVGHCLDELTMFAGGDGLTPDQVGAVVQQLAPGGDAADLFAEYGASASTPEMVLRAASDAVFGPSLARYARSRIAAGATVYSYIFAHAPDVDGGSLGAFHTAELPLALRLVADPRDEALSRVLSGAWAAFARSGDPATDALPWPRVDVEGHGPRAVFVAPATRILTDDALTHLPFWSVRRTPAYADVLAAIWSA
jgi:para-nitrobenzyl esterase